MSKKTFTNKEIVKCKKWDGEEFHGMYLYTYNDGTHCVLEAKTNKRFNVLEDDIEEVSEEKAKEVKKLIKDYEAEAKRKEEDDELKEVSEEI